jgi:tetratricopeptide (TPR) repeat protein
MWRFGTLLIGLLGVSVTMFAEAAAAQNGLTRANEILRRVQTQNGVEINLGGGEVEVKIPDSRAERSSSPLSRATNGASRPASRPQAKRQEAINQLLETLVPELRLRGDRPFSQRADARVTPSDGFQLEFETAEGSLVVNQQGLQAYAAAVREFRLRNYEKAVQHADAALEAMPGMAKFHQFRGLAEFASSEFVRAADDVYEALKVGPSWDWPTTIDFYGDRADYAARYRDLQKTAKSNPNSVRLQFLVAYHHTLLGHYDEALSAWQRTAQLVPEDSVVAAQLQRLRQRPQPIDNVE